MTDHKFTDEEVIKALEVCQKAKSLYDCEKMGCPAITQQGCRFYLRTDEDYEGVVQDEMLKDALDLINRQKAEIEELNTNLALAFDNAKNNTIERIREHTIRFVAINEFAERLKAGLIEGGIYPVLVKNTINKVLKEMTEDK
jgi:hypothetical protein